MVRPQPNSLRFQPRSKIPVTNALSHFHLGNIYPKLEEDLDIYVHHVVQSLPASDQKLQQIQMGTAQGETSSILVKMIQGGWPSTRKDCPTNILTYWNIQHKLSFTQCIFFKGEKLSIPKNLQLATLQQLHAAHLGTKITKQQVRMLAYCQGFSTDIEHYIVKCQTCTKCIQNNLKELMINHSRETRPWQKTATYLFE